MAASKFSAAVAYALAASAAAAPQTSTSGCPDDAAGLSVQGVQDLLSVWNLDGAFGKEFLEQKVDGFALPLLSASSVSASAYPSAQPFHWTALWRRLRDCGVGAGLQSAPASSRRGLSTGSMSSVEVMEEMAEWQTLVNTVFLEVLNIDLGGEVLDGGSGTGDSGISWNATSLSITNCNEATTDDYYSIDPTGSGDAFTAYCSRDNELNWWMTYQYIADSYTPTQMAVGSYDTGETFKLSDEQVNAVIGSDSASGHAFRFRADDGASTQDYFVMTQQPFVDTEPSFGIAEEGWFMHSEGLWPSYADWEFSYEAGIDSMDLSYIDSDARVFVDYGGEINCYATGSTVTRCFSTGSDSDGYTQLTVTASIHVGSLDTGDTSFPDIASKGTVLNCNDATEDGYYTIDTGNADAFLAYCEADPDGNMWMDVMYQSSDYTPTSSAVGSGYFGALYLPYKLSDSQVNAVFETNEVFGHSYRVHSFDEWTSLDYFLMTYEPFADTERGYGIPMDGTWYMHSEGYAPSDNDWELYFNDNLDSYYLTYIDNDGDRYFTDHSYDINCYPLGTSDTRCWSSGSSADSHDQIDEFKLSVHVGTLKDIPDEVYPFPDLESLGAVTNCNSATEEGYYTISTGSVTDFMAYCTQDADDNWWMEVMHMNGEYTPDDNAIGYFYNEHWGFDYKLSDAQINAVFDTDDTFGHTYRVHSHDEWTAKDYYIATFEPFDDEQRGYGAPMDGTWYMHSEGYSPSDGDWELMYNDNLDSYYLSYIDNDGDRYFTDHSYDINCYSTGSSSQRCWNSGSSADSHDEIDEVTLSVHVGTLNNIPDEVYPFPDLQSLGTITNCNSATEEGYYTISTGTVPDFMAYCTQDTDDNWWMEFMHMNSEYTPDDSAIGYFYNEHWGFDYKLSDAQINAVIETDDTFGHTYRVHSHDEWTAKDYYVATSEPFDDEERGYGAPMDGTWYMHSEGYSPSDGDWELMFNDNLDSYYLSYIDNDGDRYFTDHSSDINCYSTGSSTQRCWNSGSSADSHDEIDEVTLSLHVGTLNNIPDEVYPFPDLQSLGTIINCNNATEEGYYTISTGTVTDFMAYCTQDADNNWWMEFMHMNSQYTPDDNAIGYFYNEHWGLDYKLSDAQINAVIGTDGTFGHTYRVHGHDEWSTKDYYIATSEPFDDTQRGYGAPMDGTWYMHSEGYSPSDGDWELMFNDNLDSYYLTYIENDGDRYFSDHTYDINCYSTGSSSERCWNSGSSADSHDEIDEVTLSLHVGTLKNVPEEAYPFPDLASLGKIINCNNATEEGYYTISTGIVTDFMAYCTQDADDNWWMEFMHINGEYTPDDDAIGYFYNEHWNLDYKLSDDQINAVIATDDTFGHTYRIHGNDEWSSKDYFVMTSDEFEDKERAFGAPMDGTWYMHSEGYTPSDNDWELMFNDNLDSYYLTYIDNDGDRYFADHSYEINCYSTGSSSQRCWNSGSSADSHDEIDDVTLSLHVGVLRDIPDEVYPFPDLASLGTITNCNSATEDGYYTISTGAVADFVAYCLVDDDGNWWMQFLHMNGDYTPDDGEVGYFYNEHWGLDYKLSDSQINAVIGTEADTIGHVYRVHGHDEWSTLNYYIMTTEDFDDEERGYSAPIDGTWYAHSEGDTPSDGAWEIMENDNLDSYYLSYIDNDGNRYFTDHSYDINCYSLGTSDTRCWSSGSSADSHDAIDEVTMSLLVGPMLNIDESSYPDVSARR